MGAGGPAAVSAGTELGSQMEPGTTGYHPIHKLRLFLMIIDASLSRGSDFIVMALALSFLALFRCLCTHLFPVFRGRRLRACCAGQNSCRANHHQIPSAAQSCKCYSARPRRLSPIKLKVGPGTNRGGTIVFCNDGQILFKGYGLPLTFSICWNLAQ